MTNSGSFGISTEFVVGMTTKQQQQQAKINLSKLEKIIRLYFLLFVFWLVL